MKITLIEITISKTKIQKSDSQNALSRKKKIKNTKEKLKI